MYKLRATTLILHYIAPGQLMPQICILPAPNLRCYKRSVEYSDAKAWNSLPKDMKLIPNYLSFKSRIHKKLLDTIC